MRKDRPNQAYPTVLGIKLSPRIVCSLGESAPPPGALANEMRKNSPNQAHPTVLGIKLSPRIVCALGESALPLTSDLRAPALLSIMMAQNASVDLRLFAL